MAVRIRFQRHTEPYARLARPTNHGNIVSNGFDVDFGNQVTVHDANVSEAGTYWQGPRRLTSKPIGDAPCDRCSFYPKGVR